MKIKYKIDDSRRKGKGLCLKATGGERSRLRTYEAKNESYD